MPKRATALRVWAALGIVYLVWGSTYLGIAIAVETIPPFLMAAIRFALAGAVLVIWEVTRAGRSFRLPSAREIRDSAIVGILLLGVGNGFVGLAETRVPSGIAAILIAVIPLWFAVLGWVYFRERLPKLVILGIGVGLIGVALLVWPFGDGANAIDLLGVAILIVAPIGWSHGSLYSARKATLPSRPLMATGLQMLFGALALAGEAILTGEPARFDAGAISASSLWALLYLTLFGSLVAFNAYAWLLRNAPLSLVGTYAYVNPVVAVALGALILHEQVTPRTLIASLVIVGAVAMIVTAKGRASRADDGAVTSGSHETRGTTRGPAIAVSAPTAPSPRRGLFSPGPAPRRESSG
jgi:drug/metabolite transporter (DMT)-like permease